MPVGMGSNEAHRVGHPLSHEEKGEGGSVAMSDVERA